MQLEFHQVDAFTHRPFAGNPAMVYRLDAWLADELMQNIAAEHNLSETAFLVREADGWRIRWFTPAAEVPLCGHATLASAHVLFEVFGEPGERLELNSLSGPLRVYREDQRLALDFPAQPPHEAGSTVELEQALEAYARLHRESGLKLCASHGLQTEEEFRRMKEAGVERCHANLETSRRYFPQMCTTHTYEDKVTNIQRARAAGLEVCSGGILGMGESWEDRLDLAVSLAELEISSIPLNLLRPIPGTPYEGMEPISNEDVLRTVAFFRYINPTAWIRMAAGRGQFPDGGAELFRSGANAAITGDMLTTTGTSMAGDRAMLLGLGYQV